jgi:hypothetical protein
MSKKLALFISLIVTLLWTGTSLAQDDPQPHTAFAWDVSYWNNKTLSGSPVLEKTEANLDWDWGLGSPHASIPADDFSARWSRYIDVPAGSYRFTTTSDDGIRVYVDNNLIINYWNDHPAQVSTADIALSAGHHLVVVEYYEHGGYAVAKVSWEAGSSEPPADAWRGEYFSNATLSGAPTMVRTDSSLNFNWGYGSPSSAIPSDRFSVRWTRLLHLQPGNYRFVSTNDDGVRLWVNEHQLINKWYDQAATSHSGTMYLSGDVEVKMEYYENAGLAVAKLYWEKIDGPVPPPPSTGVYIVDNTDAGFVRGGAYGAWHSYAAGYNNNMIWTYNNDWARSRYNWARWYPDLPAGRYEVFVYIPSQQATTSYARYWVSHRDGFTLRIVNQLAYSNAWVSLGTYWFQGNSNDYVSLSDITGESYVSRKLGFDAVKWESR